MIIIFDTNIWLNEMALNSSLGAAVRFFINQRNARLALPEVVRLEVEKNFRVDIKEYIRKVNDNHRKLLSVFGKLKEVVLPNDKQIDNKIAEIFTSIGIELLHVEFSIESARSSFLKTIEGQPPSSPKNQQFKDGVLWADCVKLLDCDDVYFVTTDKGFYHERNYEKGPAKNLLAELTEKPHKLKMYKSIGEFLDIVKTDIIIDEKKLFQSFMNLHGKIINAEMQRNDFSLGKTPILTKTLYITEKPNFLYIEFGFDVPCSDLTDQGRTKAVLHLSGTGSYDVQNELYSEIRITGQKLDFLLADGTQGQSLTTFIQATNFVIGHKDVFNNVRYRIIEETC